MMQLPDDNFCFLKFLSTDRNPTSVKKSCLSFREWQSEDTGFEYTGPFAKVLSISAALFLL